MLELTPFCKFCKNAVDTGKVANTADLPEVEMPLLENKENKSKPWDIISFNLLMNKNNTHLETHLYKNSELLTVPDKFFC
jgi:hypothetical protein